MSSLLSLARKKQIRIFDPYLEFPASIEFEKFAMGLVQTIVNPNTMHVQGQNVLDSLIMKQEVIRPVESFQDVTPPYAGLWVEALLDLSKYTGSNSENKIKLGCLTIREDVNPVNAIFMSMQDNIEDCRHFICHYPFIEYEGEMYGPLAVNHLMSEREFGGILSMHMKLFRDDPDPHSQRIMTMTKLAAVLAMEACVWLNTKGTERTDTPGTGKRKRVAGDAPLLCEWKTLIVNAFRYSKADLNTLKEEHQRDQREHHRRAYRADYRKGKGLFGKIRELIWFPETTWGNPDLGCVIPEYELKGKPE